MKFVYQYLQFDTKLDNVGKDFKSPPAPPPNAPLHKFPKFWNRQKIAGEKSFGVDSLFVIFTPAVVQIEGEIFSKM